MARQKAINLNLDLVEDFLKAEAQEAFDSGDALGFVSAAGRENGLALVCDNSRVLRQRGIYEKCLIYALTRTRRNHHNWSQGVIESMFRLADRDRLRAAGAPLPSDGFFTLYRGISGIGRSRRTRGMSWTASLPVACWFAKTNALKDPAVVSVTVPATEVLCYWKDRNEDEFILLPPAKVRKVKLSLEEISKHADAVTAEQQKSQEDRIANLKKKRQ